MGMRVAKANSTSRVLAFRLSGGSERIPAN